MACNSYLLKLVLYQISAKCGLDHISRWFVKLKKYTDSGGQRGETEVSSSESLTYIKGGAYGEIKE